jgi:Protein of unknown function (DUF1579)
MKGFAVVACILLVALSAFSQEDEKAKADQEAMMKVWKEVATPGAPHALLARLAGSWETTTKTWMEPGTPPGVTKGTAEFSMILGGRFLQQQATGEMMGMPFTGMGLTGYDNFRKEYTMLWVDDSGTAMYSAEGTADASGKTITFKGTSDDPYTGKKNQPVKYVSTIVDDNTQLFEIYGFQDGKETKMMEMTYERKK